MFFLSTKEESQSHELLMASDDERGRGVTELTRNVNSINHACNCASLFRLGTRHRGEGRRYTRGVTRTGTRTWNGERRRCPRRWLPTHWDLVGGCTRHYPRLQSSCKMHFHFSTYLRMRPVSRAVFFFLFFFRSAPGYRTLRSLRSSSTRVCIVTLFDPFVKRIQFNDVESPARERIKETTGRDRLFER